MVKLPICSSVYYCINREIPIFLTCTDWGLRPLKLCVCCNPTIAIVATLKWRSSPSLIQGPKRRLLFQSKFPETDNLLQHFAEWNSAQKTKFRSWPKKCFQPTQTPFSIFFFLHNVLCANNGNILLNGVWQFVVACHILSQLQFWWHISVLQLSHCRYELLHAE